MLWAQVMSPKIKIKSILYWQTDAKDRFQPIFLGLRTSTCPNTTHVGEIIAVLEYAPPKSHCPNCCFYDQGIAHVNINITTFENLRRIAV